MTLSIGNHRTLPQRDKEEGNSTKMTKARLGLIRDVVLTKEVWERTQNS